MNVQYLEKDGQREYAVVPVSLFEEISDAAEMLHDIQAYDRAKKNLSQDAADFYPAEMLERLCNEPVLRVWREYRGLTQTALASEIGVSQAAIAGIESGKREPSVSLLKKLAVALSVDMDDLV